MVASSSLLLALLPTASALQMALKPAVKPRCAAPAMQYGQPQYGQQQGYGAPQQGYGQQQGYGGGMQQGGYGQQAMGIRIVPTSGIYPDSEYAVALGGQQVLGRRNTWSDKLTISREQCGIQVGMDGSIMLVSLGRPRTGWPPRISPSKRKPGCITVARPWSSWRTHSPSHTSSRSPKLKRPQPWRRSSRNSPS